MSIVKPIISSFRYYTIKNFLMLNYLNLLGYKQVFYFFSYTGKTQRNKIQLLIVFYLMRYIQNRYLLGLKRIMRYNVKHVLYVLIRRLVYSI